MLFLIIYIKSMSPSTFSPWTQWPVSLSHCYIIPSLTQHLAPPRKISTSTCGTVGSTPSHYSYTSEPRSCQNSNLSRALIFYLIANKFNSCFTEAAGRKKKATRVCNLQSKSAQQKYSSTADSGIQSFFKRERNPPRSSYFLVVLFANLLKAVWGQG